MKKIFFMVLILLSFANQGQGEEMSFEIVEIQRLQPYKLSLTLRISKKWEEEDLRRGALLLYEKLSGEKYNLVLMDWYLQKMKINAGSWASTHFKPELKVEIRDWILEYNKNE